MVIVLTEASFTVALSLESSQWGAGFGNLDSLAMLD